MSIEETIKSFLEDEYRRGHTHQEIADAHHVSRSYIQYLLTGGRSYGKLKVEKVEKMFPNATINLNGSGITQFASNVHVNNQSVSLGKSADAFRDEVMKKIISLDLSGDDLKKVLNALMSVEV